MNLADQVRQARRQAGLTQAGLAYLAGVSPATIHRLEAGRTTPHPTVREAIAAVLNIPLATTTPERTGV